MQDLSKLSDEELRALYQQRGQATFVPSPTAPYEAPKAAADTRNASVQANVNEATAPTTVQTNQAPAGTMWVDPSDPTKGVVPIPGYNPNGDSGKPAATSASYAEAIKGFTASMALSKTIEALEARFEEGPGSTKGVLGFQDYLPTEANQRFDRAASSARGTIADVLGFTGSQLNSAAEIEANLGPFVPTSGDKDGTIRDSIDRLKELQQQGIDRTVALLGGVPDSAGEIIPVPRGQNLTAATIPDFITNPPKAAGSGATEVRGDDYSDEYKGSLKELERSLERGEVTPEQYAAGRMAIDRREYGEEAADQKYIYMEEAYQRQALFSQGVAADQLPPPSPPNRELSEVDQLRNSVAASPLGTGVANFADAGILGGVSMIAGDQMQAANDLNPKAAMLGQIGGSIGGTAGLGMLGRQTAGRLAPMLIQGGGKSQFGRNIAADAAYGTIYGTNTGMDVSDAALASTVGSVGGNVVGKSIGKAVGGVNVDPAARFLRSRNIPLTTGQTLGGFAKNIEDAATSIPGVGDMINARRLDGLRAFNREAFDEAGRPIGFESQHIGREGLIELQDAQSQAYGSATAGTQVDYDPDFVADMGRAESLAENLPDDLKAKFDLAVKNRVWGATDAGILTGESYQQALRGLKSYRAEAPSSGFEQDYRTAISAAEDAFTNLIRRQGGSNVVDGLNRSDQSYRLGKVVQDATERAKGGSASGEVSTFTPSQLQMANQASGRRFPGANSLVELADQGQRVLPSRLPDSGTGRRIIQGSLGALALGGAGAGETALTGDPSNTALAGGALATLMLGGTRGGQRAINALFTERPDLVREAAEELAQNRMYQRLGGFGGLFGSASVPLALESAR